MLMTNSMLVMETLSTGVAGYREGSKIITPYILRLYSGRVPTRDQLRALAALGVNDAHYPMTNMDTLALTTLGGKLVLSIIQTSAVLPVIVDPEKFTVNFSAITDQSASLQDDATTWGFLAIFPRTASNTFTSWQSRVLISFTVGDENSNADLKIQGGFIPKGSNWKPNDFEISLTGGIK